MPDFTYEALDKSGSTTTGTITARDSADAAVKVRALGVHPTRIGNGKAAVNATALSTPRNGQNGAKNGASNGAGQALARFRDVAGGQAAGASGKRVSRVHLLLFTREMADLLDAGLPMDRAFSVLIDQSENVALSAMLNTM